MKSKNNHIEYNCKAFHQCVLSYVSSDYLMMSKSNHIECKCKAFHQCVLSYVSSKHLIESKSNHIEYKCKAFHFHVSSHVLQMHLKTDAHNHIENNSVGFHQHFYSHKAQHLAHCSQKLHSKNCKSWFWQILPLFDSQDRLIVKCPQFSFLDLFFLWDCPRTRNTPRCYLQDDLWILHMNQEVLSLT